MVIEGTLEQRPPRRPCHPRFEDADALRQALRAGARAGERCSLRRGRCSHRPVLTINANDAVQIVWHDHILPDARNTKKFRFDNAPQRRQGNCRLMLGLRDDASIVPYAGFVIIGHLCQQAEVVFHADRDKVPACTAVIVVFQPVGRPFRLRGHCPRISSSAEKKPCICSGEPMVMRSQSVRRGASKCRTSTPLSFRRR